LPRKKYPKHFQKKKRKFFLLLDSPFAPPKTFKMLSKKANIAHIYHTYKLSKQTDDIDIYNLGCKVKRIIISTDNNFKKCVRSNGVGVLILPPYLSTIDMDKLLSNFVSGKNPDDFKGKSIKLGRSI
jgi:predicted nuclease of predicted toxin-antitoxin system